MAFTLTQLQSQRDALWTALVSGVRSVSFTSGNDSSTKTYGSFEEMRRALTLIDAEIAKLTPAAPKSYSLAQTSKDGRGNW